MLQTISYELKLIQFDEESGGFTFETSWAQTTQKKKVGKTHLISNQFTESVMAIDVVVQN